MTILNHIVIELHRSSETIVDASGSKLCTLSRSIYKLVLKLEKLGIISSLKTQDPIIGCFL